MAFSLLLLSICNVHDIVQVQISVDDRTASLSVSASLVARAALEQQQGSVERVAPPTTSATSALAPASATLLNRTLDFCASEGVAAGESTLRCGWLVRDALIAKLGSAGHANGTENRKAHSETPMEHMLRTLHPDTAMPLYMPAVGFGTGGTGLTGLSGADAVRGAVRAALRAGFRHFDCAEAYANQAAVGDALAEALVAEGKGVNGTTPRVRRDQLFVTSKLWPTNFLPEHASAALQLMLRQLRLKHLDLLLLHWPVALHHTGVDGPSRGVALPVREDGSLIFAGEGPSDPGVDRPPEIAPPSLLRTWRALERAVDDGLVRALGVSNMGVVALHELLTEARVPPSVNQIEMHPHLQQRELLAYCRARRVHVVAHTPLGGPIGRHDIATMPPMLMQEPAVRRAAFAHGVTEAQVLLRWALQRGVSVITHTRSATRLNNENSPSALFSFNLTQHEVDAIDALDRGQRYMSPEILRFMFA